MELNIDTQSDYIKALEIMNFCIEFCYDGDKSSEFEINNLTECSHLYEIQSGLKYATVSDCEERGVRITGNFGSIIELRNLLK